MDAGFVVLGSRYNTDGKVILYASRTLTSVEVNSSRDDPLNRFDVQQWGGSIVRSIPPPETHTLKAEMQSIEMVVADSYVEAWQKLFDLMSPPAWKDDESKSAILSHFVFNEGA